MPDDSLEHLSASCRRQPICQPHRRCGQWRWPCEECLGRESLNNISASPNSLRELSCIRRQNLLILQQFARTTFLLWLNLQTSGRVDLSNESHIQNQVHASFEIFENPGQDAVDPRASRWILYGILRHLLELRRVGCLAVSIRLRYLEPSTALSGGHHPRKRSLCCGCA